MGRAGLGVAVGCAVVTCAIAAALVGRRARSWWRWGKAVEVVQGFEAGCATPVGRLRQLVDAMVVEMHAGLASDGGSKLKMLPTFVDVLPDGTEDGIYYSLDLDATSCRVLKVELRGRGSKTINYKVEQNKIPPELLTSTSEDFFNFIALELKKFVEREENDFKQISKARMELGFAFPFPIRQSSCSSGALINWTKGFAVEDVVGKDVSRCLEEATSRNGINMHVAALVNDSVGTLALGHYHDKDTVAAVIIGTDTNACYLERMDAIIKCQGLLTNSGGMVVNMEWGNFWSSHLPRTDYDIALENECASRNDQVSFLCIVHFYSTEIHFQFHEICDSFAFLQGFTKLISEIYLGEIVRRVLCRIADELSIFGVSTHQLSVPFTLRTSMMVAMLEDNSVDLQEVGRILRESFEISDTSLKARMLIMRVCNTVIRRAARLVAAGIIAILKKIGRDGYGSTSTGRTQGRSRRTVIAIESGLYINYLMFREYLNEAISEILGEEVAQNIVLKISEDGPGIGTALLAALYSSQR
ncbi:hexokinase-3-like isoform X1 [Zingiber officinale]|uniref:hexokinase-3-like isoform X1 n=1 Tax=Zingiber officinale TaxID=94328 RepID=UPI001C4A7F7F|nr:hexokinase-3-like isoform X1 [Zingiber officinale]